MLQRTEIFHPADAAATRALGAALGPLLQPGALVLLSGPLGAGKTTLVQGIAAGLGIAARIQSPTFTLVHEYPLGRLAVRPAVVNRGFGPAAERRPSPTDVVAEGRHSAAPLAAQSREFHSPGTYGSSDDLSTDPRTRLVHMDFYRLSSPAEVQSLGLEDYLAGDDIVVIEWPEHAGGALPDEALHLTLAFAPTVEPVSGSPVEGGGEGRRVTLTARGAAAVAVLSRLLATWRSSDFAAAGPAHG